MKFLFTLEQCYVNASMIENLFIYHETERQGIPNPYVVKAETINNIFGLFETYDIDEALDWMYHLVEELAGGRDGLFRPKDRDTKPNT